MWLSKQTVSGRKEERIYTGDVTMSGEQVGVYTDTERRNVLVYAPAGYFWMPKANQNLLIIKNAEGENCAIGAETGEFPAGMESGEVYIKSEGAYIWIKNKEIEMGGDIHMSGRVNITGSLTVNGTQIN